MDAVARLNSALAGRYAIERELGAGGMATVYLAHDLKHDRNVALKVLRPELSAILGAERFLHEIKTTANLQHPHILSLFDSGEADGLVFYVMPYVEGESLRERLTREKQLPVDAAVRIATEVADALEYAHEQGVVHRDIKPENILLYGGHALVADFGIALAASSAGAGTRLTETGMSLGTPHYMSPEQAMGEREITPRSDIYALGCVTYEMLAGEPPFTGPTAQAIVAKVLTAEPASLTAQRKTIPPHIEAAVTTALEKLPADRFERAADFAAALAGSRPTIAGTRHVPRSAVEAPRPWSGVTLSLGATTLALAGLAIWAFVRPRAGAGPRVYDAALPDGAEMSFAATTATKAYGTPVRNISISPAGDFAVYAARSPQADSTELWYRSLVDASAHVVTGTRGGTSPRVSPDGNRIAFLRGGEVLVVPVTGGEPRRLLDGQSPLALEWLSPTQVLSTDMDGSRLSWLDPEAGVQKNSKVARCPFGTWIAADNRILCAVNGGAVISDPQSGERQQIRLTRPDGSAGGPLVGTGFRVVEGRYLVYLSAEGDLRAAPYDFKRRLAGRSVSLLAGVRREPGGGDAQYDIAPSGTLVYAPGADATVGRLVRLASGANPVALPVEAAAFHRYDLSRDRRWLAAVVQTAAGMELRVYDLRTGQQSTWLHGELIRHPLWTLAGDRLVVGMRDSTRWSLLIGAPGSARPPDTLFSSGGQQTLDPEDVQSEHTALVGDWNRFIVMRFDPTASRSVVKYDTLITDGIFASVSPDGKHLLYETSDEGRVMVTSFPVPGRRWQLATGSIEPLWLSSSEVLVRSGVSWFKVRINPVTGEPVGAPTFWAKDPRFSDTSGWSNRPSWDGGIIYVQGPEQVSTPYLRVVPNWVDQMKAAVDQANR